MSRLYFAVVFVVLVFIVSVPCSQAKSSVKPVVGEEYIKSLPSDLEAGTVDSLKKYVSRIIDEKYISPEDLYRTPFMGMEGKVYISVTQEKAMPVIAGGVSAYAGNEEGLAASLYDGTIRIWSDKKCSKISLPSESGARLIGYAPGSPSLVAADADGDQLYVYNLDSCSRIPGDIPVKHAPIKQIALSSTGEWLSYIDAFNTLFSGPSTGPMEEISVLEGTPIYLGYTPSQGIMVAVQGTGRIIMRGMMNNLSLKTSDVPGGPFISARMSGYVLCLTRDDGRDVYWNITSRKVVNEEQALETSKSWVYMDGDSLVYSTGVKRWKVEEHLGMPLFIVSYSKEAQMLRVRDLDHTTKYYSVLDGKEFGKVKSSDWEVVSAPDGVYKIGESKFKLFDMVYQKGPQRLYCRYIDGKGFYLWWDEAPNSVIENLHPMELPIRRSILADTKLEWIPLKKGNIQ